MKTVFISGSITMKHLNNLIKQRLTNIIDQNLHIVVGDANGADKAVQHFLFDAGYNHVTVFCSGQRFRNNLGNWNIEQVIVRSGLKGRDFYTEKDKKMALIADYGFVLWNGQSAGSLNNVMELLKRNKKALIYFSPDKSFHKISTLSDVQTLLSQCEAKSLNVINRKIRLNASIREIENRAQGALGF